MVNFRLPAKSKNGILQPVVIANFAPLKTHVGIQFLNALPLHQFVKDIKTLWNFTNTATIHELPVCVLDPQYDMLQTLHWTQPVATFDTA